MLEERDPASVEQGEPLSQGQERRSQFSPEDGSSRAVGRCWNLHRRKVPVPVVLVGLVPALVLALIIALAALSGGQECPPAPVLGCPYDWVGYHHVCYYISKEEGTWDWSRERCSSLRASLAVLRAEWEVDFLTILKDNANCWLGLRRQDGRLEWVDGSSYNLSTLVQNQAPCLYLNDRVIVSSSCSRERPYICSKPSALVEQGCQRRDLVCAGRSPWPPETAQAGTVPWASRSAGL
ncbi:early activation antigen CD69-like isoform 2-T2 [Porphyrio hochstetteri]